MSKNTLVKTRDLIVEYNDELFSLLRKVRKAKKDGKTHELDYEILEEAMILLAILLSGNIKVRYELAEYIKDNSGWGNLSSIKNMKDDCMKDIEALKSESFALAEILKTKRFRDEQKAYKEQVM